jgi:uncharacterized repeat protein (TIGR03803 family)
LLVLAVVPTSASVLYVNANNSSPSLPYQDWASAATRIQDAVDAAAPGDTVLVTNGVYDAGGRTVKTGPLVNRVVVEKAIQLASVNGPEVTVIQGNQVPGVTNGDGAIRCVYLSSGATLSGFTLTNGATLAAGPDETLSSGGGIWCESKSAVVLNCKLIGNSAPYGGAAAGGSFNNCTLIGNSAFMGGAVRGGTFSNPALDNCALNNCTLSGNSSYYGGGSFGATLNNCFLGGNSAVDGGGVYGSTLNNCTLTGNSASDSGGGANKSALNNCIVYNNNAILTDPNYQQGTLNYCCTTPLPPGGTGNITNEPALAGVWRLSSSSPCRGAGSAAYTSGVDMDGEPWLNPPSIGCDEYHNGSVIGSLSVGIAAAWTNVAPGFAIDLQGLISGYASDSRWEFGDGTIVSNHLSISHAWLAVGAYSIVFRAYSDSYPGGVSASATINAGGAGGGTFFKMTPGAALTRLAEFQPLDFVGSQSEAPLLAARDGNLYGLTSFDGAYGRGTIFRIDLAGRPTALASFTPADGFKPVHCQLAEATDGNLYGTTSLGGAYGKGTLFRLSRSGELKTVFSFQGANGNQPLGLVQATDGHIYGITVQGGNNDGGTVFRFETSGGLATLVRFSGANGWAPASALMQARDGRLYGATTGGGNYDDGTIFRLTTNGLFSVVVHFNGRNGSDPEGGPLMESSDGYLYGTTCQGGSYGKGTVFKLTTNGALTTLFSFSGSDGSIPWQGLV